VLDQVAVGRDAQALSVLAQQPFDGNVLVDIGPVDTVTTADEAPVLALGWGGVAQAGKPFQWRRKLAAIGQGYVQQMFVGGNGDCRGIKSNC
jgi:hypothetical protein